jgi:hypothetical protein
VKRTTKGKKVTRKWAIGAIFFRVCVCVCVGGGGGGLIFFFLFKIFW